jgi:predicted  nucleic acid-binding Zn-ribbon protein
LESPSKRGFTPLEHPKTVNGLVRGQASSHLKVSRKPGEFKRGTAPLTTFPLPRWGRGFRPACHSPRGTASRGWGRRHRRDKSISECHQSSECVGEIDIGEWPLYNTPKRKMSIAQQLYQLQELDLALAANEREQARIEGQLGASQEIAQVKAKLETEQERLGELERQQHAVEWEVEDLTLKLTTTEEKLFGGTIRNPKELTNLQREAEELKTRRTEMEDRVLDIMDQAEATTRSITTLTEKLGSLESDWHLQQEKLFAELEEHKTAHGRLTRERQALVAGIVSETIGVYEQIRSRKGTAVARVEQGTCRGCQIALTTTELQQARGGSLVRCGSCGRILFLA